MECGRDMTVEGVSLFYIPVRNRVPLKFGVEGADGFTCARVRMTVSSDDGKTSEGWGETPLNLGWLWPSSLPPAERFSAMRDFCGLIAAAWCEFPDSGHPMELGHIFISERLPLLESRFAGECARRGLPPMPHLAALGCASAFDIALYDAYGELHGKPSLETLDPSYMKRDLEWFFGPEEGQAFRNRYPSDFLSASLPDSLQAWHLVGGSDTIDPSDAGAAWRGDGIPSYLSEWIRRDGLECLKIKLFGEDPEWDFRRVSRVAAAGLEGGALSIGIDFNCTVREPAYLSRLLDRLEQDEPPAWNMLRYIEQPFAADLGRCPGGLEEIAARKPLVMDESLADWRSVRAGKKLGWNGVALKTCKTLTGSILSLCMAKAQGMLVLSQDLTNPMLAQIAHVQFAARAGSPLGLETNSSQFCPNASLPEAMVHPGIFARREGRVHLESMGGTGMGYRIPEIRRDLPDPAFTGRRIGRGKMEPRLQPNIFSRSAS